VLHGPAALADHGQPVGEAQGTGEYQGRVLAQAQAGGGDHVLGRVRLGLLEGFEGREAGDEDGRLADVGGVEPLGRPAGADVEQVVPQVGRRLVEQGFRGRQRPGERGPHADVLGTLTGEEEGGLHGENDER
jgi:hypothetical protein